LDIFNNKKNRGPPCFNNSMAFQEFQIYETENFQIQLEKNKLSIHNYRHNSS